jgi:RNA polymerase sigma-70 factor (ECF subfamily)
MPDLEPEPIESAASPHAHGAVLTPAQAEAGLLAALRSGDEVAFVRFVDLHHAAMVRVAARYVRDQAAAEEVAQEAWVAFLQSLARFEARSSLKTWLFRTLLNCARNRKRKDVHSVPFSAAFDPSEPAPAAVEPSRFRDQGAWAGHWSVAPRAFGEDGERRLLQGELRTQLLAALESLPPAQREVITLRDMEGFLSEEVCEVLNLSEANQRVLLHRARSRVRAGIEAYFDRETPAAPSARAASAGDAE